MIINGKTSPHNDLLALAVSPDGKLIATAGSEGTVRLWEVATLQEVERINFQLPRSRSGGLAFTPDGRTLVCGGKNGSILIWDWALRLPGRPDGPTIAPTRQATAEALKSLAESDPARGQAAVRTLVANGGDAVTALAGELRPVPVPDGPTVARLIDALASAKLDERERAGRELSNFRESVRKELTGAAANHQSPEVRDRCQKFVAALDAAPEGDRLLFIRGVQALELIASPAAVKLVEKLAQGPPGVAETEDASRALNRLKKE
jgi:hypothetical protein